jgi:hypothetical protein
MGPRVMAARARDRAVDLAPILAELQADGVTSLDGLAAALNERGMAGNISQPLAGASAGRLRWYPASRTMSAPGERRHTSAADGGGF